MRVLITGGCGFVGVNLVTKLEKMPGWDVRVFDNESLGQRSHLPADFAGEFVHGDLRDVQAVEKALEAIDAVVHLAADTRVIDSIENPQYNFEVNVIGTLNVLEGMRKRAIKKFVNASTGGAIIGHADGPVNETMLPAPLAPYGASKLAVEGYCSAYAACYGFSAVSLRFANVYGPASFHKGSVVAAFFKNILAGQPLTVYGDGSQVRDYVYVGDICEGIVSGLTLPVSGPIQLGSGKPVVLNDLIEAMRDVTGTDVKVEYKPARVGEIHSTYCDVSRAKKMLDFKSTDDLKAALANTWEWFVAQKNAGHKAA